MTEALHQLTEKSWSRDCPELSHSDTELTVSFTSRSVEHTRTLLLVSSDATDSVTVRLRDELGEIFSPTGPWQLETDANADLAEVFGFAESLMSERVVRVLTSEGEHRLLKAEEAAQLAAERGPVQVRSWLGNLDESPPASASWNGDGRAMGTDPMGGGHGRFRLVHADASSGSTAF